MRCWTLYIILADSWWIDSCLPHFSHRAHYNAALATLADMASGPPWIFDPFRSSETFFTKAITACGGRSGSWRFALDIFGALRVPWAWIVLFRFVHHRVWLGRGAKLWAASNVLQHRDECLGVPRKTCLRWDWEVGRWTLMRGKKTSTPQKI